MIAQLAEWIIRGRYVLLAGAAAGIAASIAPSWQLQFDRRIESMFRASDPRYQTFLELKRDFGGLETCLVAYDDADLFTIDGMERLHDLRRQLLQAPGVSGVFCLANARRPTAPLDTRLLVDQLRAGVVTPEALRAEILANPLYRGRLVTTNGITAVLWVDLTRGEESAVDRGQTIRYIRDICRAHLPPAVFAGGPVLVDDIFTNLERDGWTLGLASSVILTVVIALLFRSLRWVLLPLAVVQATLLWTKALLAVSGMQLSMVSSPLTALVTVIGVATVVHVAVRFREERMAADSRPALKKTLLHVGPAIFWTCLTTVAGFAALMASQVTPVQSFGLMMALGVGLVLVATLALAPGFVLLLPSVANLPGRAVGEQWLAKMLQASVVAVKRHPRIVILAVAGLLGATSWGVTRLKVATDFNDNYRQSSPIVQSFHFLVARLEGINTIDVLIDAPPLMSREFEPLMTKLRALQTELELDPLIADTLSVVDLVDFVKTGLSGRGVENPAPSTGGLRDLLSQLPSRVPERATLAVLDLFEPHLIAGFWNRDARVMRVVVQAGHADGAEAKRQLVERIEGVVQRHFPEARTTGIYVLMVFLVQSLLADQWVTFAISLVAIFTMMWIAFGSWRLGVAALLPNVAPILMVVGAMGWLGLKINMATAMLASVSLGLSVDFSIHYLSRFRQERRAGRDFFGALEQAHGTVGLAMILANLALIAGFLVLLMSPLIPTVHFGLLVSVAMLGGLIGNLLVLPLILRLVYRSEIGK